MATKKNQFWSIWQNLASSKLMYPSGKKYNPTFEVCVKAMHSYFTWIKSENCIFSLKNICWHWLCLIYAANLIFDRLILSITGATPLNIQFYPHGTGLENYWPFFHWLRLGFQTMKNGTKLHNLLPVQNVPFQAKSVAKQV